jgi:3-phenylpropionate/trans-cinnamate dioxygenase ferredoxin reductase subunit
MLDARDAPADPATAVVIVGNGMAGATVAATLRTKGFAGPIALIGDEPHAPYQRPPLSKGHLVDGGGPQLVRPEAFWADKGVDLITGTRATAIDRDARVVRLDDGRAVPYAHLVLATGARNRELPGAENALALRTLDESRALRERIGEGRRLVVIGGGFIGLEVAAAAHEIGTDVTVVEALDRVMSRVVSPEMSAFFAGLHAEAGVKILTGRTVQAVQEGLVVLDGGERLEADAVVVGIGVVPNVELAVAAGLEVSDGIVVDERLLTSDPAISAVGDCAHYPCAITGRRQRLESVQNATDHARACAARIAGAGDPYAAVPWFWSDQHGRKLQIAGVAGGETSSVLRGDPAQGGFSIFRFADGALVAVESVDAMPDHIAARKLLAAPGAAAAVTPEQVADPAVSLKELAAGVA